MSKKPRKPVLPDFAKVEQSVRERKNKRIEKLEKVVTKMMAKYPKKLDNMMHRIWTAQAKLANAQSKEMDRQRRALTAREELSTYFPDVDQFEIAELYEHSFVQPDNEKENPDGATAPSEDAGKAKKKDKKSKSNKKRGK